MVACFVSVPFLLSMRVYGKTLQVTLLLYLMYVCVFIYRNDSLLMTIYKYEKKMIRLEVSHGNLAFVMIMLFINIKLLMIDNYLSKGFPG